MVTLLALFSATWLLVSAIAFNSTRHEVDELFDANLSQAAAMIASLIGMQMDSEVRDNVVLTQQVYGHSYERKISFQIWQKDQLLLRSRSAPLLPMAARLGFSELYVGEDQWHVFGLQHQGLTIYAGENEAIRNELVGFIVFSALMPLLLALPLLAWMLWLGIGRGLGPITAMARQVALRDTQNLEPIDDSGSPREIVSLIHALNNLLARVRQGINKERRFTADASHELRTPLTGIKTQAQVALQTLDPAELEQALRGVIQGVDRSGHLVDQMLTLSRLDPEGGLSFMPVDLAKVAGDVISELAGSAMEKEVELALLIPDQASSSTIRGHDTGVRILLRNLLHNAIRHTPPGGEVSVTLQEAEGWRCLQVTDTGPGIPEEQRERVLERFYRPPGAKAGGSGLGLSIVKRIAQLHRANLRLGDNPTGSGLCVEVCFPLE
jgi:two-component system sensor histidine kinase QseC